ncbi:hypothetical protein SOVF_084880 [Spinacia oleracea]|nr:hypothetical protein SOVF_084880 [Spinacia oleracea]
MEMKLAARFFHSVNSVALRDFHSDTTQPLARLGSISL